MEQFQIVTIGRVFESPLNPRKYFNEKKMEELVESIKAKGVLVPLLVRQVSEALNGMVVGVKFEIASGHRRYRAAGKAGLKEVPLIVREMSDADFLDVLIIENDKHEALEPLEQAQGYKTLMDESKYDIPGIALRVSKSESYVYQRLKLLELIPEAQKLLIEGGINAGHAILIARLQPDQQKELLKKESGLYEGWGPDRVVVSVRDLADYIERQIHLDLNSASFKKSDPDLIPEAGPCTTCRKRTGFEPALFPETKKKDTCTDPSCFHKKVEVFTKQWIEKKSQDSDIPPLRLSTEYDGRIKKVPEDSEKPIPSQLYHEITDKKKDICSSAREGIITDGKKEGRTMLVCVDPKCEKHHRRDSSSPEDQKWKAQQKVQEEKRKQGKTFRLRIIDEIIKDVKELDKADLAFIAGQLYDELWQEYQKDILQRHDLKPIKGKYTLDTDVPARKYIGSCNAVDLGRLLMEMALIRHQERHNSQKVDPLLETAKRYHVDPKKIEAQVRSEIKEKKEKTKKKSASVKQKRQKVDRPKAQTIAMKDLCKLHSPMKRTEGKEGEIRVAANQNFLSMVDKSYSGDLLANGGNKIRNPFEWEGDLYVCLGGMSSGTQGNFWKEAWKVMSADLFKGETYTYDQIMAKWNRNEKERGNHHGQRVLLRNKKYILEGPKIVFCDPKLEKAGGIVAGRETPGVCRECGCTETTPCAGGCAWVDKTKTLCTACQMAKEHLWEKQNLVTVAPTRKVPMHDIYKCKKCGAMGKRFGVGLIKPDKPFTELKCPGPKVQTSAKKK